MQSGSYLSVAQAAERLSVHPSTIRRWIEQGRLPVSRLGVKASDLDRLVVPRAVTERPMADAMRVEPLTLAEQERGLRALDELERLNEEDLRQRGGKRYSPSWQLLDKARRERVDALTQEL